MNARRLLGVRARAERGAHFLDTQWPRWAEFLLFFHLIDMGHPDYSLLAELYGGFEVALDALGISYKEAQSFGFIPKTNVNNDLAWLIEAAYLDGFWLELVRERQATARAAA